MKTDLIVIIILNLNKSGDLIECLESIYSQNCSNIKIIVVDNGSTDDSVSLVKTKFPDVIIEESKSNLGVAGGRNLGIKSALSKLDFKYILFLDNDVIIEKNFIHNIVNSFSLDKKIGIAAPKCLSFQDPKTIEYAGGLRVNFYFGIIKNIGYGKQDDGNFNSPKFLDSCGGLFMTTNSVLNEVGLFDEKFNPYGWEDVDFSIRAKQKGIKIFYNPHAVVLHKGGKRSRKGSTAQYESSKIKNYFYLLSKHATIIQKITLLFCLPCILLFALFSDLGSGNYKSLFYKLKGIIDIGLGRKN